LCFAKRFDKGIKLNNSSNGGGDDDDDDDSNVNEYNY
jgi:hypothetical protein